MATDFFPTSRCLDRPWAICRLSGTIILFLLLTLPAAAAEKAGYLALTIKKDALMKEMMSGKVMMLPEFEIYDAQGFRIYHSHGLPDSFRADVQAALAGNSRESHRFSDIRNHMLYMEGKPLEEDLLNGADFVFVEYWADWCSSCQQQMKQVESIIGNHPDMNILWLKVEKDPTKLEGMEIRRQ